MNTWVDLEGRVLHLTNFDTCHSARTLRTRPPRHFPRLDGKQEYDIDVFSTMGF